jgi:ABC transporter, permease/ATP-binding protein, hlyB family
MLINEAIRDVAVFSILAVATFQEKLSVGEFLTYSIGVLQLSLFIQSLLSLCSKLAKENSRFSGFWTILNEADMDVPIPVKSNTELEGLFTLDFENVSFRYPNSNQYAIQNISFHIKAGSQVALVGTNGAGKSTIIKLICRLFTPESGTIKLNGVDIETIPIDEYYRILSVVLQTGSLLPYSIENNITLSEQTDLERYNPALELSEFYRVQNNLPSGKYTMVSHIMDENGIDLSGGERQKLLLARAIYHGGKVYLFDEPSGAIDPLTEERIYNNYRLITKNSTSIIISHQLSFVSLCDHIILLKNGKICEEGNHEELIEKKGIYYEMYISQKRQYEE